MSSLTEYTARYPGNLSKAKLLRHGTLKYENLIKAFIMKGYVDAEGYGKDELLALGYVAGGSDEDFKKMIKESAEFDDLQRDQHFGPKYDPDWGEKIGKENAMFCKKCGAELADDAQFCSKCGTAVAQETTVAPAPQAEAAEPAQESADAEDETVAPQVERQAAPQPQATAAQGVFTPHVVIRDYMSIFWGFLCIVFFGGIGVFLLYFGYDVAKGSIVFTLCIAAIPFLLAILGLREFLFGIKGFQIDLQNRILWAPPGKSFSFSREYINIDDIQQISGDDRTSYSTDSQGRVHESRSFNLQIIGSVGTFGTRRYSFKSERKRDELYSAIVELNGMGTPIV